ncbi:hypothetical protein [Streptomyces sp. NPDC008092]|uniref:hypothetical protein n=1 Tax=Streptomyces sp. NPDC008092 TaxID=3364808 RepID=UPI0036E54429
MLAGPRMTRPHLRLPASPPAPISPNAAIDRAQFRKDFDVVAEHGAPMAITSGERVLVGNHVK